MIYKHGFNCSLRFQVTFNYELKVNSKYIEDNFF